MPAETPEPILSEVFEGFDIYHYADAFLASRQGSGYRPSMSPPGSAAGVLVSDTLEGVRTKIRQAAAVSALLSASSRPSLIGSHLSYNLVSWNDWVYAAPRALGSVDFTRAWERSRPEVVSGPSAAAVERLIDDRERADDAGASRHQPHAEDEAPVFIAARAGFNIVLFASKYFAIHDSEGTFDIGRLRASKYTKVFVGSTLQEVTRELEAAGHRTTHTDATNPRALKTPVLVLAQRPAREIRPLIETLKDHDVWVLAPRGAIDSWSGYEVIPFRGADDQPADHLGPHDVSSHLLDEIKARGLDTVVIPYGSTWNWAEPQLEQLAQRMSARLIALFEGGRRQVFKGQDIHRILYNKAYLASMFTVLPSVTGQRLLDVGCSDGLVCNMLLTGGPKSVTGIDVLKTVGCNYPNPNIAYFNMDAEAMQFADDSFDIAYSIATFEHVSNPLQVINEMRRVTRSGGYCYVQAGPLYFSPFGHHMFGYFDEFPWIHLRLEPAEIVEYAKARGVDAAIQRNLGRDARQYVEGMLRRDHINGKTLSEYQLDEFADRSDIEILKYTPSFEGENLLTPALFADVRGLPREVLVGHGFEVAFRVK